ncbi:hypothetical protein [Halorubellus salinus]|uniref:hypothetical protein n=1 Tax=Halorubellus salinus TaxID=755309 RepID=UPI001D07B89D|nr:hypothetical protein [Halorubellus salinus]
MRALIHNDRGKTREYEGVSKIIDEGEQLRVFRIEEGEEPEFTVPEGSIVEVSEEDSG